MKKIDYQALLDTAYEEAYHQIGEATKSILRNVPKEVEQQIASYTIATAWQINKRGRSSKAGRSYVDLHMARTDRYDRDIVPFLEELSEEEGFSTEPTVDILSKQIIVRFYNPFYLSLYFFLPTNGSCTIIEEEHEKRETYTTRRVVCK